MLAARFTPDPAALSALPVLPMPCVVLLPGMILPLNVFQAADVKLVDYALSHGRHVGVPLLRPRGERTADGRPAIEQVFGVGKLVSHVELPDGRRLIRLEGCGRARLVRELPGHEFRLVESAPLAETYPADPTAVADLRAQVSHIAACGGEEGRALESLLAISDARVLLYAITAFLPSLELMAGHQRALSGERGALAFEQQRSLAAETADARLEFLSRRIGEVVLRVGQRQLAN